MDLFSCVFAFLDVKWDMVRKEEAPFIPEVKDIRDTSNHLQKNKVYEENEKLDPFFSKNKDNSNVVIINSY